MPEDTIALLDTVAGKGTRSTFIDTAIRKHVHDMRRETLRERLKAGAISRSDRDLAMSEDWFAIEEELWQK